MVFVIFHGFDIRIWKVGRFCIIDGYEAAACHCVTVTQSQGQESLSRRVVLHDVAWICRSTGRLLDCRVACPVFLKRLKLALGRWRRAA